MADTARTLSSLQTLLANNSTGAISAQDIRDTLVSVYPQEFVVKNAVADGTTDDTAVIQAEIDAAYTAGGGTVVIPPGDYGVTSLTKEFLVKRINVNIVGAGQSATNLKKIGATTTPIIDFYATGTGPIDTYSLMSSFRVTGSSKSSDGIRLTRIAKADLHKLEITDCDTGLDNLGAQIFTAYSCAFSSNNVGYMSRLSEAIYANLANFVGGQATGNTTHGIDIGQASGVNLFGTFIERNGTSADTATGGLIIRSTVDDEFGGSIVDINNCWFENNDGMTLRAEAATGLHLSARNTHFISAESGNVADIAAIKSLTLDNVIALSSGDTIISAAGRTLIRGGIIHTYTDNSTTTKINHTDSAHIAVVELPQLALADGITAPATLSGYAQLYVDTSDGDLKVKFGDGTVKTISVDT